MPVSRGNVAPGRRMRLEVPVGCFEQRSEAQQADPALDCEEARPMPDPEFRDEWAGTSWRRPCRRSARRSPLRRAGRGSSPTDANAIPARSFDPCVGGLVVTFAQPQAPGLPDYLPDYLAIRGDICRYTADAMTPHRV